MMVSLKFLLLFCALSLSLQNNIHHKPSSSLFVSGASKTIDHNNNYKNIHNYNPNNNIYNPNNNIYHNNNNNPNNIQNILNNNLNDNNYKIRHSLLTNTLRHNYPNYYNDHHLLQSKQQQQQHYSPQIPQKISPECDFLIESGSNQKGHITSPGYPDSYRNRVTCKYLFKGEGRERVILSFDELDLKTAEDKNDYHIEDTVSCEDMDTVSINSIFNFTNVTLFKYCGKMKTHKVMSHDTRLEVIFVTAGREDETTESHRGFSASYSFVSDFGIKGGVPIDELPCGVRYNSSNALNGTITSPNYPGTYPRSTECHYLFYGMDNEQVVIQFLAFDVKSIENDCKHDYLSDYVEFSNFYVGLQDRKMGRWCGSQILLDRPVISDGRFFRVSFHSNPVFDSTGFEAYYEFHQVADPDTLKSKKSSFSRGHPSAQTLAPLIHFLLYSFIICAI